jgi:protein TonB
MKKERKPESFLQKPSYLGGPKAMRKFLSQNIRYPEAAKTEKIEGTVRVRMDIDHQGTVIGTKILAGLGYGCDEEAQRVVKLLVFQLPKLRKIRATFHKTINIHFRYPQEAPVSPLNYTVTQSKAEAPDEDQASGSSYSYTITL